MSRYSHGVDPSKVAKTGDIMTGNLIGTMAFSIISTAGARLTLHSNGTIDRVAINDAHLLFLVQAPTISAPAYQKGGMYFDITLNKMMIGGATGWETVTSA